MLLAAACTSGPTGPDYGDPDILFKDDFSQTTSGWDQYSDSLITTNYDDGQYLLALEETGKNIWALPGLDLTNLTLEVDTAYVAGPDNNEYGVICRYSSSGNRHNFYFFFISSDGYYAMGKIAKDRRTILNPANGDFQLSESILLDKSAVNRLSATCSGERMSFSINGVLAGEFTDAELTRGDFGLIIGTYDEGGVQIRFDNLTVRRPGI
jgi:hypothetical protein